MKVSLRHGITLRGSKRRQRNVEEPSSKKRTKISSSSYKSKLEVNQIVPLETEKGEEYVVGLFIEDLEVRIQSSPIENRLKDVEERVKTNEEVMERLQILERKDGVESLPDETDQVLASNEEEMKIFNSY
ncbi:Hypothetical predicted protein [Olea europaea subsp. europaea]|uniref:Uncharacterized protein n=1 Tax=Olea europaea subsp. europaea TaxID=158383 RepID=A0A8S0TWK4_OLEEU|nr:Hypothetical predicted protein [Olea europaea subsp. europaea]